METTIKIHEYAIPVGAQFYSATPRGTPQMWYKWETGTFNDGTPYKGLCYLSFAGIWMGSGERDPERYVAERLISIN